MDDEYIEREAFIAHIRKEAEGIYTKMPMDLVIDGVANEAKAFPSADVALVRHGRWKFKEDKSWVGNGKYWCSVCRYGFASGAYHKVDEFKFCPMCGAKMDKEVDNGRL